MDLKDRMEFNDVHRKMVRNVFLNIELLLNDCVKEICEYDVQSLMFLHFRKQLVNTEYRADREKEGKVDCVIYKGETPCAYYEIKTYFKKNEKLIQKHFDKDISKIRSLLDEKKDARGYIFIVGKKSKFSEDAMNDFKFISDHLKDSKKAWYKYGKKVRLRPSVKEQYGQSVVITWEIKI